MKKQNKEFIIHGPIRSVILTIAMPLMINNLIRTLYNLTDGLYVARLSAEDFAATAFIWPLNFLFIAIGMGISIGATSLIAQLYGSNEWGKARVYAGQTLFLTYILGFLMTMLGYLGTPYFIYWMGATGEFASKAIIYLKINFIGLFFDFCYFGYQAILNAQGKTRTITIISTISSLVNVTLDPFLIFAYMPLIGITGLNWGIAGAAWATVVAKIVLLLLAIWSVNHESNIHVSIKEWRFDLDVVQKILKIALPSAMGYSGAALGFTVLNGLIQSYGTSTLAAYSMVNRISDLFTQPQMGIGGALTAIIGQNVGAMQFDRAKAIFKEALKLILIISICSSLIILTFRHPILSIFIKDNSDSILWEQAVEYLNFTAFIIFFMGIFSAFTGFFQGYGKTMYSMTMAIGRLWFIRLPIIWVLGKMTTLGSTGIWIAMLLSNALICVYGWVIYLNHSWTQSFTMHEES